MARIALRYDATMGVSKTTLREIDYVSYYAANEYLTKDQYHGRYPLGQAISRIIS